MDDPPLKPPESDPSEQTLDTHTSWDAPGIGPAGPASPRPADPSSAFSPGDRIAKRFRIERFIAHGGMGEVYEALDIELKHKVALKSVRSVMLGDVQALERFRQEIVVAKRVTHLNVCRTYDLFRHEATKPGESDVLVVSMEYLRGQTLDHFLSEKGKLSPAEAAPLVRQMLAGLSAAHQAGVVHRDFKPSNVLLVRQATGTPPVRAVITDFGLAHSLDPAEFSVSGTGEMLGTPAFMAPEQVTGKTISPATDIYALGIVLFLMVTGQLPFSGENWRAIAYKRLQEFPPSPKSLVPDLDEGWSRTILKCLERDPAARYQTVEEVEEALDSEVRARRLAEIASRQRRRMVFSMIGLVLVAAIGIIIGVAFPNLFSQRRLPSVAVLGFKNLSGDPNADSWGNEFRTNLGTSLDVTQIRYLGPDAVEPAWNYPNAREMPEEPTKADLAKLYDLGCRYAVFGTYTVEGTSPHRRILWSIRLVDTKTGRSLGSSTKRLGEEERLDVVATAGSDLRKKLGVSLSPADKRSADHALPANEEASRDYAEGLAHLQNFQYEQAKDSFQTAVQADPQNAEIRSALAEAWWKLGYETNASEEAKRAMDLASLLSGEKNSLIQARFFAYAGQWDQAANLYRALWTASPEKYSYALLLAESEIAGKHYADALRTLQKLEAMKPPGQILKADIQLQMSEVQDRLGNPSARLQAAASAVQIAKSLSASLLQARAEIAQCQALLDLGKVAEASQVCAEAVELNKKMGDDLGTARAQNDVANGYYKRGEIDKAKPLYSEALALAARIGDKRDQAGALLNLGNIQRDTGNLEEAKKFYEQSIQVSQERTGINNDLLLAKQGLAVSVGAMGQVSDEIRLLREVVEEARSVGDKSNLSGAALNLCSILLITGDVPAAKPNCEESVQLLTEAGDKTGQARAHQALGDALLASDDLPGAEREYLLALHDQVELGAKTDVAYTQASLADLSVNKRDFSAAETYAQPALQTFLSQKDAAGELLVRCTLVQVNLGQHQLKEAQEEIGQAAARMTEIQDPSLRAIFQIQQGIVENAAKPSPSAQTQLRNVEVSMRKAEMLQIALEAKLARGETLSGAARETELQAVAREAKQHGYLLLARKASAAVGG
jgi:eukaryotic-like serine/threonine-protein kinase